MIDVAVMIGFLAAALVVLILPGPGVLYVVARSVSQGRDAGLVSAAGLSVGALVHVAAAAGGLSAILLTSASAFATVKLVGAAYLIYLGVAALRRSEEERGLEETVPRSRSRLFWDGVLVSALNPKIAVFFLAFLPQFVDASRGLVTQQVLLLGVTYCMMAWVTDSLYAIVSSQARRWVSGGPRGKRVARYAEGSVYIGLGLRTGLLERG